MKKNIFKIKDAIFNVTADDGCLLMIKIDKKNTIKFRQMANDTVGDSTFKDFIEIVFNQYQEKLKNG